MPERFSTAIPASRKMLTIGANESPFTRLELARPDHPRKALTVPNAEP
jgi:hypothetical protein